MFDSITSMEVIYQVHELPAMLSVICFIEQFICKSIIEGSVDDLQSPMEENLVPFLVYVKLYLPWKSLFLLAIFVLYVSVNYFHGGHLSST